MVQILRNQKAFILDILSLVSLQENSCIGRNLDTVIYPTIYSAAQDSQALMKLVANPFNNQRT